MHHRWTASADAGFSRRAASQDDVRWLRRRGPKGLRAGGRGRRAGGFLRLTASLSVGALLTISSAGSAIGPAAAHSAGAVDVPATEPRLSFDLPVFDTPIPGLPREFSARREDGASAFLPRAAEPDLGAGALANGGDPQETLRFGGVRIPRRLVETILRAADETGVDPAYMMALADKESSFIADNKAATSSAEGLFQFIEKTWLEVIRDFGPKYGLSVAAAAVETVNGQLTIADDSTREGVLGLRRDPYLSALMAAEMLKRDKAKIERRLGRALERSELYLMHFLGAESAAKLLELVSGKPKQSAPKVFPAAAKANKTLFFAAEKVRQKTKIRHLTVAEVYGKIDRMIDARLDRYEGVSAFAPMPASFALQ
jgi:hypothetical protein